MGQTPESRIASQLLRSDGVYFMEAHDAISAQIAQRAGFDGIWASSLTLSSVLGMRDANEATWTELVELAGRMARSVDIPVLWDGDNALGHFNTMRQMVRACHRHRIAGIAIEDKAFPKRNSLLDGCSELISIKAFQGIIRAGLDTRATPDFTIVARTEALINGLSMSEALDRAGAYTDAGAEAILIHSKSRDGEEILRFLERWNGRAPVVLVPTTYHTVGTGRLVQAGGTVIVWANHLLRSSMSAMMSVAKQVRKECTVSNVEASISPLGDLFELLNYAELDAAEERY